MSDSETKPEAKRRGRPPQYGKAAVRGAVRQQWHREKRQQQEQDRSETWALYGRSHHPAAITRWREVAVLLRACRDRLGSMRDM